MLSVLVIFPSLVDFLVWVYNVPSPSLGGLPFFWWFQIFWLGFSVVPYAAYAILLEVSGGFSTAFAAKPTYVTLPSSLAPGYATLVLGSALALYLYPHSVNGVLSSRSTKDVRKSTAILPLYGLGLAFLALFGVLIFAVPSALSFVHQFPASSQGIEVVPSLILTVLPNWLAGIALLGIFIGGLVPAAIMAIAQANLLTRNIIKEFRPNLNPKTETGIAKWASAIFKFIALGFVFAVPATYAIQLQLLGGVLILQLLPPVFIGLYTKWWRKEGLIAGLLLGVFTGVLFALEANKFGPLVTSLYSTTFGALYIAVISLAINLLVCVVVSAVIPRKREAPFATASS